MGWHSAGGNWQDWELRFPDESQAMSPHDSIDEGYTKAASHDLRSTRTTLSPDFAVATPLPC